MNYAGIGSRETPKNILDMMFDIAVLMGVDGHTLHTGAALGADQAFGNGANKVLRRVELALPWGNYESAWVNSIFSKGITVYKEAIHVDAKASVHTFHPAADRLTQGAFKLQARNFLILQPCQLVICWTKDGKATGGTGQAIRIAEKLGIPVHNLHDDNMYINYFTRLEARRAELEAY
jgi:hypothetical protein